MRGGQAVLISTIAHAALIVLVVPGSEPRLVQLAVPELPHAPPPPPPVEISLVDMPSSAGPGTDGRVATRGAPIASAAVRTSDGSRPAEVGSTTGSESGITLMHMRTGVDLDLDHDFAQKIASAPGHRGHEPTISGKVEHANDGTGTVHDDVTKLSIDKDGTAHFHDKAYIDIHFHLPVPTFHFDLDEARHAIGKAIDEWYADPYKMTRYGRTQDLPAHLQAAPGACDQWDSVWCEDPLAPDYARKVVREKKKIGSFGSGRLGITDWLHKKFIGDPYASRKLKLLDDTRDERIEMGAKYRSTHLDESREMMPQNLIGLWQKTASASERKTALFELWDECAEGEGAVGEAGDKARAVVIDWIREHLPKGSPNAFTDEELAGFTARRSSKQPFEPY